MSHIIDTGFGRSCRGVTYVTSTLIKTPGAMAIRIPLIMKRNSAEIKIKLLRDAHLRRGPCYWHHMREMLEKCVLANLSLKFSCHVTLCRDTKLARCDARAKDIKKKTLYRLITLNSLTLGTQSRVTNRKDLIYLSLLNAAKNIINYTSFKIKLLKFL